MPIKITIFKEGRYVSLISQNIFLPIYWKGTKNKGLSDTIFQIPVDKRYNSADMERVATSILKYL